MNSLPAIWTRVSARATREYSELATQAFLDAGCEGVQIDDVRLEDRGEDAAFIETPEVVISSYLVGDNKEIVERVRAALREYSVPAPVETETIDAPDWSVSWRENFPVLEIGKWTIAPTWETLESAPEENKFVIRIDPGLAFGTGQHPTTRMCLELIGERADNFRGKRVLDVGCGSGVLSIAAARLGAQVAASDLDPHCIEATRENAALNEVEIETFQVAGLDWVREPFPIVMANLMSDLLISLAPALARVVGSTLIVSGISSPRADEVEAALQTAGFTLIEKREQDGELRGEVQERWAAFVFARNGFVEKL
jgi:ribosomal protein L11 methyltransferase